MSIDKEVLKSREALVLMIQVCNEQLNKALLTKDRESVASQTYLIAEYEQMLEEFDAHHNISKT